MKSTLSSARVEAFNLALVQMKVMGGKRALNMERALALVAASAQLGADVVLLPEALNLGWTHPSAGNQASPIPDSKDFKMLIETTRRNKVHLCTGWVERCAGKVFNSAALINPKGQVLSVHRKLNELEIGHPYYQCGDRLQTVSTRFGTFGVMVCADAFVPGQVITRALGHMGAQVILSPSSWAVPANHNNQKTPYGKLWVNNYGPVARDFRMWIASASNVGPITAGPWKGRNCIGCSMIVSPTGQKVAQADYGVEAEQILIHRIEPVPRQTWGEGWRKIWKLPQP